ncbi:MAG: hypothetical protein M1827_002468 [Pycnora praestabilis]|nr:MAG: hypothetical protein M1827_002468 [Pycnora praestabilis]
MSYQSTHLDNWNHFDEFIRETPFAECFPCHEPRNSDQEPLSVFDAHSGGLMDTRNFPVSDEDRFIRNSLQARDADQIAYDSAHTFVGALSDHEREMDWFSGSSAEANSNHDSGFAFDPTAPAVEPDDTNAIPELSHARPSSRAQNHFLSRTSDSFYNQSQPLDKVSSQVNRPRTLTYQSQGSTATFSEEGSYEDEEASSFLKHYPDPSGTIVSGPSNVVHGPGQIEHQALERMPDEDDYVNYFTSLEHSRAWSRAHLVPNGGPHDATIPHTQAQQIAVVKRFYCAITNLVGTMDFPVAGTKSIPVAYRYFAEKKYKDEHIQVEKCTLRHMCGPLVSGSSAKNFESCAKRIEKLCEALQTCKTICKSLMDHDYIDVLVDNPSMYMLRAQQNKKLNASKGLQIRAGRTALGKTTGQEGFAQNPGNDTSDEESKLPMQKPHIKRARSKKSAPETVDVFKQERSFAGSKRKTGTDDGEFNNIDPQLHSGNPTDPLTKKSKPLSTSEQNPGTAPIRSMKSPPMQNILSRRMSPASNSIVDDYDDLPDPDLDPFIDNQGFNMQGAYNPHVPSQNDSLGWEFHFQRHLGADLPGSEYLIDEGHRGIETGVVDNEAPGLFSNPPIQKKQNTSMHDVYPAFPSQPDPGQVFWQQNWVPAQMSSALHPPGHGSTRPRPSYMHLYSQQDIDTGTSTYPFRGERTNQQLTLTQDSVISPVTFGNMQILNTGNRSHPRVQINQQYYDNLQDAEDSDFGTESEQHERPDPSHTRALVSKGKKKAKSSSGSEFMPGAKRLRKPKPAKKS